MEFPDVYTPEETRIVGLEIGVSPGGEGYDPKSMTRVAYVAEGVDAETVFSEINGAIQANSDWEVEEIQEPDVNGGKTFLRSSYIIEESVSSEVADSQFGIIPSSDLAVIVQQIDDGPVTVDIQQFMIQPDEKWEALAAKYAAWRNEVPFPEGAEFELATVEIGMATNMSPLKTVEIDPDGVNFSVALKHKVESGLSEDEMVKEIVKVVNAADGFKIEDVGDAKDAFLGLDADAPGFLGASFSNLYVESNDFHEINFEAWTSVQG